MTKRQYFLERLFLQTRIFALWQQYCRLRDRLLKHPDSGSYLELDTFEIELLYQKISRSIVFRYWKIMHAFKLLFLRIIIWSIYRPIFLLAKLILPEKMKQLLKRWKYSLDLHVGSLLKHFQAIDASLKSEVVEYYNHRSDNNIDVLIFGVIAFDYRHQRPQHLAEQLAQMGHRVFYVENEFIPGNLQGVVAPFSIRKQAQNLYVVKLASPRQLFIYNHILDVTEKDTLLGSLKNLLRQFRIVNPIAKIDHPFWTQLLPDLAMPVVYDCMDDHAGFAETGKEFINLEENLVKSSDVVLVSSNELYNKWKQSNYPKLVMLKNAGEFSHFASNDMSAELPNILAQMDKKVIGYHGALANWFDVDLVESVALEHPECEVVLIGRVQNSLLEKKAKKIKNLHLLGEVAYAKLAPYIARFDVCMIPFLINDLIRATHPVKIFEYFAMGKPVVATDIPELHEYQHVMKLGQTKNDFVQAVSAYLLTDSKKSITNRINIARANTWQDRGDALHSELQQLLFPRVSVVLLSYNKPELLDASIHSVLQRSMYPNIELIIVDNASSKETVQILHTYKSDPRVKVIFNKENLGFSAGNNIGLRIASGDYIVLLNNDVQITPGWINRLLYHTRKKGVGLVGPVTNRIGNEAQVVISYTRSSRESLESSAIYYTSRHWGETMSVDTIAAFCWMMSKQTYKVIGNLDERFGQGMFEDDDYCMRVRKAGLQVLIADDVFVHHEGKASFNQIDTQKYQELFERNKALFEKKWHTTWKMHTYRPGVS